MTIGASPLLAATVALLAETAPMHRPLTLLAEPGEGMVRLVVKGQSATSCEARYELEVQSGKPGASNRSRQSGVARLEPGKVVTVATVTVGNADGATWNGRLAVSPCGGERYEVAVGRPSD